MDGERPLHAHSKRDLAHGEGLAQAAPLAPDDDALKHLDALPIALDHPHVHLDGVAGAEFRQVVAQARILDEIDGVHSADWDGLLMIAPGRIESGLRFVQ